MAILLRQSDETRLNNFPKDYMLPTFFSPLPGNYKEMCESSEAALIIELTKLQTIYPLGNRSFPNKKL